MGQRRSDSLGIGSHYSAENIIGKHINCCLYRNIQGILSFNRHHPQLLPGLVVKNLPLYTKDCRLKSNCLQICLQISKMLYWYIFESQLCCKQCDENEYDALALSPHHHHLEGGQEAPMSLHWRGYVQTARKKMAHFGTARIKNSNFCKYST